MTTTSRPVATLFDDPLRGRLVALRRDLHRHPELSGEERRTADRLHEELAVLRPTSLDRVAETGLVARMAGTDPGAPTVAIRGDIDALPIEEETGLPYSSQHQGVMHACGHDVHAAWTVGAAHLLAARPARGDVLIVLQPAEEIARGALAVLASDALDGVSAIFGGHVDRTVAVGEVIAQAGPVGAATDTFSVELVGGGGHGARPHETVDPVVALGALIGELQTIVARRLAPGTPAVVTVGSVRAGSAPNVIPTHAALAGTLRSMDPRTRAFLHDEVRHLVEAVAGAHRLASRVEIEAGTPPVVNSPPAAQCAARAVEALLGADALAGFATPNMGGEDFGFYLERLPGAFLRIGAREPGGEVIPAHSPRFHAAEESLFVGAAVLAETARIACEDAAR
ncbi:MAG: M20 metallopeptidase family protein [Thermoanaerobaculia bacterium]